MNWDMGLRWGDRWKHTLGLHVSVNAIKIFGSCDRPERMADRVAHTSARRHETFLAKIKVRALQAFVANTFQGRCFTPITGNTIVLRFGRGCLYIAFTLGVIVCILLTRFRNRPECMCYIMTLSNIGITQTRRAKIVIYEVGE